MIRPRPAATVRIADGYEVVLAVGGAIAAAVALIDPTAQSRALTEALQTTGAVAAYNAGCTVGALAVVTGWAFTLRWLRGRDASPLLGLVVERLGLLIIGPLYVAYGAALFVVSGTSALFAACITTGVGTAHLLRAWRVDRDLRAVRGLFAAGDHAGGADGPSRP